MTAPDDGSGGTRLYIPPAYTGPQSPADPAKTDYWEGLIHEEAAARFLGFSVRTLQGWRYRGGGPRYVRVSHRGVRYRRKDCAQWAEEHIRTSTSDRGVNGP